MAASGIVNGTNGAASAGKAIKSKNQLRRLKAKAKKNADQVRTFERVCRDLGSKC